MQSVITDTSTKACTLSCFENFGDIAFSVSVEEVGGLTISPGKSPKTPTAVIDLKGITKK